MIYGYINDQNIIKFIKMIDRFRIFPIIDHGVSLLQPVNGKDLGKAYYQILNKPEIMQGDYNLSGEKPITMLEMFNMISAELNKKITFVSVPLGLGVFMAKCLKICTFGKVDYVEKVLRMGEDRNFSHTDAEQDFGYKPMHFNEGLKLEINQYLLELK
jgi:nucleoside-diphosphate-sugar epimerase